MAVAEALDILPQIQTLVSDRLQVVSYKWLSRKFLVSSNHAKSLLQEFVDRHGDELEVIYTVSGWLKDDPGSYHVRLASSVKLAEIKSEFKESSSIQVYSVQACIPKDPAVLWSAEFVQAEELFNEPSAVTNCLRDNRFSSVTNSFVERTIDGKSSFVTSDGKSSLVASPQSKTSKVISLQTKTNPVPRHSPAEPSVQGQEDKQSSKLGTKNATALSSGYQASKAVPEVKTHQRDKESKTAASGNKEDLKEKAKTSSGTGGSLANLWGRASAKPKEANQDKCDKIKGPTIAGSADALIFAQEAENVASSDDEKHEINYKREANSGRKRKVVMDFSDDEEDDVVNIASPNPPIQQPSPDSSHCAKNTRIGSNLSFEDHKKVEGVIEEKINEKTSASAGAKSCPDSMKADTSLQVNALNQAANLMPDSMKSTSDANHSQKRKVLKTKIDERGREVTEVIWEGDAVECAKANGDVPTNDSEKRPPLAPPPKPQVVAPAPSHPAPKGGNKKTAKAGGGGTKNAKQGNIMSFFKKV